MSTHILGPINGEMIQNLQNFKETNNIKSFRDKNIEITQKDIKSAVTDDNLITQCIHFIDDLNIVTSKLAKRIKDWYSLYDPETVHNIEDHEAFLRNIGKKQKNSMGADFEKKDLDAITSGIKLLQTLYDEKNKQEKYLETVMKRLCPNLLKICGAPMGATLLQHAGSLKRLALMPSSTVQLLGAETALFQHLIRHTKPPKHGYIVMHPFVASAKNKGKAARTLADKISIAVRVDYFKGEYIADKLLSELEQKKEDRK